ncbi:MAG: MTH938/NDUFAF3 family protein, partial [Comamonadaceae bacterium]|nr:MTH938/NDUFAF3 family protein [Comamonadaceae bacterium]
RIGLETMSTPAACRTYNILAGEGRRVLAALLIDERSG